MEQDSTALRIQASLLDEVRKAAMEDGTTVEQFVNVAIAEKLSALRTQKYFQERAARADVPAAVELLRRMGQGRPPMPGDEIDRPIQDGDLIQATVTDRERHG